MSIITNPTYIRCVDSSGNSKKVTPLDLVTTARKSEGYVSQREFVYGSKWYRIGIGTDSGNPTTSCLLNIGSQYNTEPPRSQLFYIAFSGYSANPVVQQLAKMGKTVVSKVRLLYKASNEYTDHPLIDILITDTGGTNRNRIMLSYSCATCLTFQQPEEVSDTPDAGYTVKEFSFA